MIYGAARTVASAGKVLEELKGRILDRLDQVGSDRGSRPARRPGTQPPTTQDARTYSRVGYRMIDATDA